MYHIGLSGVARVGKFIYYFDMAVFDRGDVDIFTTENTEEEIKIY
jgi:hypothetical protein